MCAPGGRYLGDHLRIRQNVLHSTAHVFLPPELLYTCTQISAQMPVERHLQTEISMASQNEQPNSSCLSSVLYSTVKFTDLTITVSHTQLLQEKQL